MFLADESVFFCFVFFFSSRTCNIYSQYIAVFLFLRVLSIGKCRFRFENLDFGFEISVFGFLFTVQLGNPKKDLTNCP